MKKGNIFWGFVCLSIAVVIILSFTGVLSIPFFEGISTGKFIATVILLIILISSLSSLTIDPAIASIGILIKLYDEQMGFHVSTQLMIIVIILLIAAYHLLFPRRHRRINPAPQPGPRPQQGPCPGPQPGRNYGPQDAFKSNVTQDDGDYVTCKNYFNGITKYINSKNFKGATIDSAFGGTEIYFTNAEIPSGHATLEIHSKFGGVSIYVPHNWKITNRINSVMGAVEEAPMILAEGESWTVELELIGDTSFSGVEIKRI